MSIEMKPSTGTVVVEDREEVIFREKVDEWANGKISYDDLYQYYPSHSLSFQERFLRFIGRRLVVPRQKD